MLRLLQEGAILALGQVVSLIGSLILVRTLTGLLTASDYGELALGLTIASLVNQVVMGGLAGGIGRYYPIAAEQRDLPNYLRDSTRLLLYGTSGVLGLGLTWIAAAFVLGYKRWIGLGTATLVYALFSAYCSSLGGLLNAARQRGAVALHGALDAWLKIALALSMVYVFGSSGTAVIIGFALSATIITISQSILILKAIPLGQQNQRTTDWGGRMWRYARPIVVSGGFSWAAFVSPRWALELFATTKDVGQFFALTQITYTPVSIAGGTILSFLVPIVFQLTANASDRDRIAEIRQVIWYVAAIGLTVTVALSVITYFFHAQVFSFALAPEYRPVTLYAPPIILAAGLAQVQQTIANIVAASNATHKFLLPTVCGSLVSVLLNMLFTREWGVVGLVGAMVVGGLVNLVWIALIVVKHINREDACKLYA